MSRLLMTAAVLAVLIYTMVLGVRWLTPRIENDISSRVTTSLAEQGLLWADVDVKGREVTLSGVAPDAEGRDRALTAAAKVFGVAKVDNLLVLNSDVSATTADKGKKAKRKGKAEDYALTITKEGDKVMLSGKVGTEADKAVLMRLADTHYGEQNVDVSGIEVVDGAPGGWRTAAGTVLFNIVNMESAVVTLAGHEIMVSGTVLDEQFSDQIERAVKATLPVGYKVAFATDVETPAVASADVSGALVDAVSSSVEPAAGAKAEVVSKADVKAVAKADAKPVSIAKAEKAVSKADCGGMAAVEKEVLHFEFDKARLSKAHTPALERVAGTMQACADEKLLIAGFTDKTGSALYNKWLSQQRAEATLRGLMRQGVDKARMKAVGYGDQHPVGSNTSRDGRAQNRRVEFHAGFDLPYVLHKVSAAVKKAKAKVTAAAKEEIKKPWWAKRVDAVSATVTGVTSATAEAADDAAEAATPGVREEERWLGDHN